MTRGIVLGIGLARIVCLAIVILMMPVAADAQSSPEDGKEGQAVAPAPPEETMDVFDLWRKLRHKEADAQAESWDYRKPMMAFAPVIGAKPSSGVLFGAAGNVAFYRGDPSTTRISSMVASLTFSTKKQTSLTNRFTMFARDNRWRLDGDHRFQWTSLETYGLGTSADTRDGRPRRFRFLQAAPHRLLPAASCSVRGRGPVFRQPHQRGPRAAEKNQRGPRPRTWNTARPMAFRSTRRSAAGTSLDLLWDNRDSFINADHGWLAKASYRTLFDGFLGGDSSWQKLNLDVRTYVNLSRDRRHKIAFWAFADLVVGGVAPFFDLPSTAGDTYGRSARGYAEGQFRGERLAYGEIEYRATLTRNGLLGMVAFLNTTTVTNLDNDERLFDSFATGGRRRSCVCSSTSDRRPTCASTSASASRVPVASTWRSRKPSDRIERNSVNGRSPSHVRRPRACRTGVAHGLVFGDRPSRRCDLESDPLRYDVRRESDQPAERDQLRRSVSGTALAPPLTFGVHAQVEV